MGFIWQEDKDNDDKYKIELQKQIDKKTIAQMNTNSGLLADIKKLKKKVRAKDSFEVDEYEKLVEDYNELKKKSQDGETETEKLLRESDERYSTEIKKLTKRMDKKDKRNSKSKIKEKIMDALNSINCLDVLKKSACQIIQRKAKVENGKVSIDGKTVKKYVKGWSESTVGKNFIGSGKNKGGSSKGSKGDEKNKGVNESIFDIKSTDYSLTKQIQLKIKNPKKYEKYKAKYN